MTRSQDAIRQLFKIRRDMAGNLPPLPAIFPDTMAPVVRVDREGERERPRRHRQARGRGACAELARQQWQQRLRHVKQREGGETRREQPEAHAPHPGIAVPESFRRLQREGHATDARPRRIDTSNT